MRYLVRYQLIVLMGLMLVGHGVGCKSKPDGKAPIVDDDGNTDVDDTDPDPDPVDDDGDVDDTDPGPCVPICVGRSCGDDGCGGSCGTCTELAAPFCDELAGECTATCTPICGGRNCGSDGCGGVCGSCVGSLECSNVGICVPPAWTCEPVRYATGDQCDCECGAPDPDCTHAELLTSGCAATERCGTDGQCSPIAPAAWSCPAAWYGGRDACDCQCGAVDPDCDNTDLQVRGCTGRNAICTGSATCECTPSCGDNVCGDDGCGGSCGPCADPEKSICSAGQCVSACEPSPVRCNFAECGNDACGGVCGMCEPGTNCLDGACVAVAVSNPLSCFGKCGNLHPEAGCSCAPDCVSEGSCCPDYDDTCGSCLPTCGNKVCGPDGCGGTCGVCEDGASCSAGVCITGCVPNCDGKQCGDNGCGGQCGTCGSGESCEWTGRCVPETWFCASSEYADGFACRCGCGVYDPNCDTSSIVFNCPESGSSCSADGICSDATCTADHQCNVGQVCYGTYYQGNARFAGVCAPSLGGGQIGSLCSFDGSCATGVCARGQCRRYCASDGDCPGEELCVAYAQRDLLGDIKGFVNVCEFLPANFGTCAAQGDCPEQACVGVLDPTTLTPRYTCATASRAVGASCNADPCPRGQHCVGTSGGRVCSIACPGGNSDCPIGWRCGELQFYSEGFDAGSAIPKMPVCVPN